MTIMRTGMGINKADVSSMAHGYIRIADELRGSFRRR